MNGASEYSGVPNLAGLALFPSATVTTVGTTFGSTVGEFQTLNSAMGEWEACVWQLDVTAAATAAGDTLDVSVQTMVDGTNWIDMVHFTQVLGNGSAKRFIVTTNVFTAQAMVEVIGTALAAGAVRHLFGDFYRVKIVIATASAPSFTFSVKGNFIG